MQAGDPGFTTAAVRPGERAEHWRHALGRLSDVHALHLHDQDSFAASVATVQLSGGTMM